MRNSHYKARQSHLLFAGFVFLGAAVAIGLGYVPVGLIMVTAWIVVVGLN